MFVCINNICWEIVFTNDCDNLRRNDGSLTIGITDGLDCKIYIFNKLKGPLLKKVLIHELTHAYMFSYNYYLTLDEEEFVCSFIDTYGEEILNNTDYILNKGVDRICFRES